MKKETRHMRTIGFALAMLAFATLAGGCLFDTREAQEPATDTGQITLDDALDVFASMRSGLENDASANYERAIGDEFIFSPLLDDSLDQAFAGVVPSPYADWTKEVERDVTNLLLSDADTIQVEFTPSALINENTFVRYRTQYALRVVLRTGGSAATYEGVAYIDVRRIRGNWQVTYWDEIEPVEGASTWGFLRGTLRQRLQ
jgi:hypothetical protein